MNLNNMEEEKEPKEEGASFGAKLLEKPLSNNIWESCSQAYLEQKGIRKVDRSIVFLGDKGCGKSALIQIYLNQYGKRELHPSAPLEYSFGRKTSLSSRAKEVGHIYEVGGGKAFTDLLNIPLRKDILDSVTFALVLDLSKLNTILHSLRYWLGMISLSLEPLAGSNGYLNDEQRVVFEGHEDRKYLKPVQAPVVVIANKYDKLISEDPEKRKWLCRALRFFCHRYGCSLIMTSLSDKPALSTYKSLISHFLFRSEFAEGAVKEYTKPLYIPLGSESMSSIGDPEGIKSGGPSNMSALEKQWVQTVSKFYPQTEELVQEVEGIQTHFASHSENKLDTFLKRAAQ